MIFRTIGNNTEAQYKELGSKFLSFAFPVSDESQVKSNLGTLRKRYYDARHHCYGFIMGMENQLSRANDDGEPSHSAGDPILGQIRSMELTNVLVIVVRYFGGTKLGIGGLVRAYKTAAYNALSMAEIVEIFPQTCIRLTYEYDQTAEVERLIARYDFRNQKKNFTDKCSIVALIPTSDLEFIATDFEKIGLSVVQVIE